MTCQASNICSTSIVFIIRLSIFYKVSDCHRRVHKHLSATIMHATNHDESSSNPLSMSILLDYIDTRIYILCLTSTKHFLLLIYPCLSTQQKENLFFLKEYPHVFFLNFFSLLYIFFLEIFFNHDDVDDDMMMTSVRHKNHFVTST